MKINNELINKIFNNDPKKRIKIKNKSDKIKISKYEDFIPMYDIYSEKIYPINKENLYYRLTECHYRFITNEIKQWIKNKYNKNKDKKHLYNLEIIDNYDIETLLDTSYKILYKYSHQLGLSVSICKRNSFNRYSNHLNPYYTKDELIKLGLNMEIIKDKNKINLNDEKIHYQICKKISNNDISTDEIIKHNNYIIEKDLISLVANYSFMGSYFMNRYLRGFEDELNPLLIDIINKMGQNMLKTPKLDNDYYLYRFIWDDNFIRKLKTGDKFIDKGFLSSTRDPFYSPGLKSNFGLILIKIKIPKNKNIGLLIENFSLFPKEEEFLLPPSSEFKLISKNQNFKYYHTNKEFEDLITTKYEFELIGTKFKPIKNKNIYYNFKTLDEIDINGESKINIIKNFINNFQESNNVINLKKSERNYTIYYNWFDGTDSYNKLYYNKINNGMLFVIYDENSYPYLNIEFGDEMIVNYINQLYFFNKKTKLDDIDIELISNFAYIFKYDTFKLFLEYDNFSNISKIDTELDYSYLYNHLYCSSLYEYLKDDKKFYSNLKKYNQFIDFKFGYWKLNKIVKTNLPDNLFNRFKSLYQKNLTIKEFISDIIENHFYYYHKLKNIFQQYKIENIFNNLFVDFDVISYYKSKNININKINIQFDNNFIKDDSDFKLVFNQPIRRIN